MLGFLLVVLAAFWAERSWGHIDDDTQGDRTVASCRGYCSVPGPLQSVQRAELWGSSLLCRPVVVCIWVWII